MLGTISHSARYDISTMKGNEMDIIITNDEARKDRVKLTNRTYRSIHPGDIVDFGSGEIRYREAVGYGSAYDGFTRDQATVDVKVQFGIATLWMRRNEKFTIWRKK